MRLRKRRTADSPVDPDGTAPCARCGAAVPVRPDGTCDLGHWVTSAEQAGAATPIRPEPAGQPSAVPTPPVTRDFDFDFDFDIDEGAHESTGGGDGDDGDDGDHGAAETPTAEQVPAAPTASSAPAAQRTAVALEELLDFGGDPTPSALDGQRHAS